MNVTGAENLNSSVKKSPTDRDLGLAYADSNTWNLALIHLNHAARKKQLSQNPGLDSDLASDLVLLDALGEAAYRNETPEALGPYQNYYKYPAIANHMARAFLMLGDLKSCQEFLSYAKDSALKSALYAMTEMGSDVKRTAEIMFPVAVQYPDLYYPEFWRALAAIADALKNLELTQLAEQKSKQYAYKDPNIHFNQALRMLGHGEFQAGWRLYEWRLVPGASQSNRTELGFIPMWEGEFLVSAVSKKTLLIFLEQGLGDCLFALRYVNYFLKQNILVQIVTRTSLIDIIKSSFPDVVVLNEDVVADVDYWQKKHTYPMPDYWVYALSIPYRANLIEPQLTAQYLKIPGEFIASVSEKIKKLNPKKLPVYSINWYGRIDTEADRTRAFTVEEFYAASGLDQIQCVIVSIQKEATPEMIENLQKLAAKNNSVVISAADQIKNFSDTAAWILSSQRLITNDTSVAHLSGALGHPTTVLARNKAIWQWLRTDFKNSDDLKTQNAIWYDSVDIQYALAPEISWLFTTTKKDHPIKPDINDNQGAKNENHIQQTNILSGDGPARKKINFAGRTES